MSDQEAVSSRAVTSRAGKSEAVRIEDVLDRWRAEADLERLLGEAESEFDYRWVTLAEAEALAGASRSTLRAWYRSGQIPSRVAPGKHGAQRMVPLELVEERVRRSSRIAGSPRQHAGTNEEEPVTTARPAGGDVLYRLAELATAQATDRARAAEERAAAAETALRHALERAAAAEAEARLLRERLDQG